MRERSISWEGKAEPRIICAAILYNDEILVVGPRHSDSVMLEQVDARRITKFSKNVQGFIDQFGDFWTRQEAWKIAEKNGQIYRRCGGDTANGGTLYSENLY